MSNKLIDLSGKIRDPNAIDAFRGVHKCAQALGIPYLIVGASARDLVMHHAFGVTIQRQTTDIDFAVQVANWDDFESLKAQLGSVGNFTISNVSHRLYSSLGTPIDIVPFGGVADDQSIIKMPPNEFPMNVLGFKEALDSAYNIQLSDDLVVKVASPEGFVLLKFIAWTDRAADKRGRDAADIGYMLNTYEEISEVKDSFFDSEELINKFDGDIRMYAAHRLGQRVESISSSESAQILKGIFECVNPKLDIEIFKIEMNRGYRSQHSNKLLEQFIEGFNQKKTGSLTVTN